MQKRPADWFTTKRRLALRHGMAASAFHHAEQSFKAVLDCWELPLEARTHIRGALYQSAVISYARPFAGWKEAGGKQYYKDRYLRRSPRFDVEVHRHLLALRHTFLAHADHEAYPPGIKMYHAEIEGGGHRRTVLVGAVASIFGWQGVTDKAYARRAFEHAGAALTVAAAAFDENLAEFARVADESPDAYDEYQALIGRPLSQVLARASAPGGKDAKPAFLELDAMDAQLYRGPDTNIGGPEYEYGMLNLRAMLTPRSVPMPNGDIITMSIIPGSTRSADQ